MQVSPDLVSEVISRFDEIFGPEYKTNDTGYKNLIAFVENIFAGAAALVVEINGELNGVFLPKERVAFLTGPHNGQ